LGQEVRGNREVNGGKKLMERKDLVKFLSTPVFFYFFPPKK
jgi:hypothetical protein